MMIFRRPAIILGTFFITFLFCLLFVKSDVSAHGVDDDCSDTGKWGIHTGDGYNPGGVIVRTKHSNGTAISHWNWTIRTVDRGAGDIAGYSILHTSSPPGNNLTEDGWSQAKTLRTGDGNYLHDTTETNGRLWCYRDNGHYNSYA